ncbi:MAG: hypothetical protein JSV80_07675 [Acidobacteriota bacterium]|nr:MAG: hypothetical protein JSV80_07675 [Acidobacteriota bacterium]
MLSVLVCSAGLAQQPPAPNAATGPASGMEAETVPDPALETGPEAALETSRAKVPMLCTPDARIGAILVERVNVFDLEDVEADVEGRFYRLVNLLHRPMLSRPETIRSLLALEVGEPCDWERLEEAERILRSFSFVQDAWIDAEERHGDLVTVRARVQDAWSTRLAVSIRSEGGVTTRSARVREVNLLGTGASLAFGRSEDQDRTEKTFEYEHPALGEERWRVGLDLEDNSDGDLQRVRVRRPFYTLDERWAVDGFVDNVERDEKVYVGSEEVDRWRLDGTGGLLEYGWSPRGYREGRLERWRVRLGYDEQRWWPTFAGSTVQRPDLRPVDRERVLAGLRAEWWDVDFRRVSFVNTARRVEDLDLGRLLTLGADIALPALSDDSGGRLFAAFHEGFELSGTGFLQINAAHEIEQVGGRWIDALTRFEGRLYLKPTGLQTLYFRILAARGDALSGHRRFLLGGDTGLRAYESRAFSGERLLLLTAEHRFFSTWELGQLMRVGLVGFVELGGAWDSGTRFSSELMHPGVGIGLRGLVLPSSGGTTLHLDVAFPLDDEGGEDRIRVSFRAQRSF